MPAGESNVRAAGATLVGSVLPSVAVAISPRSRSFGVSRVWRNEVVIGRWTAATSASLEAKPCKTQQTTEQDTGLIWSARLNAPLSIGMCILP